MIIVSGESGAGKTESTKYMVRHVVHMCQRGQMELNDKIVKVRYCMCMNNNKKNLAKTLTKLLGPRPLGPKEAKLIHY